jgi:hypothetical protein
MEAKNYPIYTSMYHPEYMLLRQTLDDTDEIAFRYSLLVNRDARTNSNKILGYHADFFAKWGVSRVPASPYTVGEAYGYSSTQ